MINDTKLTLNASAYDWGVIVTTFEREIEKLEDRRTVNKENESSYNRLIASHVRIKKQIEEQIKEITSFNM